VLRGADEDDEDDEDEPPRRRRRPADSLRRRIPTDPEDILYPSEYRNYRNVRAIAVLFVILGAVLALGGVGMAFHPRERTDALFGTFMTVLGLAGIIGGIATLAKSRRWAPLIYVMAAFYLLAFPVGTILGAILLMGLSKYLDSAEIIKRTRRQSERE
jgi:hypothetical protein